MWALVTFKVLTFVGYTTFVITVELYEKLEWLRQELLIRGAIIDWHGGEQVVRGGCL